MCLYGRIKPEKQLFAEKKTFPEQKMREGEEGNFLILICRSESRKTKFNVFMKAK